MKTERGFVTVHAHRLEATLRPVDAVVDIRAGHEAHHLSDPTTELPIGL